MSHNVTKYSEGHETLNKLARELQRVGKVLREAERQVTERLPHATILYGDNPDNDVYYQRAQQHLRRVRRRVLGLSQQIANVVRVKRDRVKCPRCPTCGALYKTWVGLVKHLAADHEWFSDKTSPNCLCGFKHALVTHGITVPREVRIKALAAHLAGQKDLASHVNLHAVAGDSPHGAKAVTP